MELCKGGELFDQFTRHSPRGLTEARAGRLMADMFSAVRYLHAHNIVHRDLKMENFLFLDGDGDDGDGGGGGGGGLKVRSCVVLEVYGWTGLGRPFI